MMRHSQQFFDSSKQHGAGNTSAMWKHSSDTGTAADTGDMAKFDSGAGNTATMHGAAVLVGN